MEQTGWCTDDISWQLQLHRRMHRGPRTREIVGSVRQRVCPSLFPLACFFLFAQYEPENRCLRSSLDFHWSVSYAIEPIFIVNLTRVTNYELSNSLVFNRCFASFLQVFREITKVEFFFIIIIMTLEEFYNIFQNIKFNNMFYNIFNNIFSKIYLFLRGMFLFVFWIINFGEIMKAEFFFYYYHDSGGIL